MSDLFAQEPTPSLDVGAHCSKCGRFTSDNTKDALYVGEDDEHTFSGTCATHGRGDVYWGRL